MPYNGTNILVTHFRHTFQYLVPLNGEIYQDHVTFIPDPWRMLIAWLGFVPLYTKDQLDQIEQVILSGAMKTIDELKNLSVIKGDKDMQEEQTPVEPVETPAETPATPEATPEAVPATETPAEPTPDEPEPSALDKQQAA